MKKRLDRLAKATRRKAAINAIPVMVAAATVMFLYAIGVSAEIGWGTYLGGAPALVIIILTALFRINDIKEDKTGALWQLRRVGLALAGTAAVSLLMAPIVYGTSFPTWRGLLLYWGVALTWITTPNQPPWWKYINTNQ